MTELVAVLTVLVLPGLAVGLAAGLRGWALVATAGMVSYAVVAATGTVCALTGLSFSPISLLGGTVLAAAVLAGGRAVWSPRRRSAGGTPLPARWAGWRNVAVMAATALGCGIGFWVVFAASDGFSGVPQDWDAQFHANAIRHVAETGNADPASLAAINRYDDPDGFYYPNRYYLMAAAAFRLSGGSVLLTHDATIALIPPLLTLGLVGLLHRFRARPALAAATAVLSATASALPYDLITRGPLTPYATGVVLIPAFLVLLHRALGATGDPRSERRSMTAAVLAGVSAAALAGIHPSVAITAAVFALALLAQRWLGAPRAIAGDLLPITVVGVLALMLSVPAILGSLDSVAETPVFEWPADLPAAHAIGDLIAFSHLSPYPRWFLLLPLIAGVMAIRTLRPLWWVLGASAVFGGLFLLSAAYPQPFVGMLNRPWWNDRWRIVAIATVGTILLAAHGAVVLSDILRRRGVAVLGALPGFLGTGGARLAGWAPVAPLLVAGVLAMGSNGFYAAENAERLEPQFADGPGMSDLELEGMKVLATMVPPGARVMNQNNDGSSAMYAVAGVRPVNGHIEVGWRSPAQELLLEKFNKIDTNLRVQAAVERLNIEYVFLSDGYLRPQFHRAQGLRYLDRVESTELVYANPDVQIYRVHAPGPTEN